MSLLVATSTSPSSPPLGIVFATSLFSTGINSVAETERADGDFVTSDGFEANGSEDEDFALTTADDVPMSKMARRPPCLSLAGLIIVLLPSIFELNCRVLVVGCCGALLLVAVFGRIGGER